VRSDAATAHKACAANKRSDMNTADCQWPRKWPLELIVRTIETAAGDGCIIRKNARFIQLHKRFPAAFVVTNEKSSTRGTKHFDASHFRKKIAFARVFLTDSVTKHSETLQREHVSGIGIK
jgi:hypothetical protein